LAFDAAIVAALVGVIVASLFAVMFGRLKLLAKIQILLTILLVVAFVVGMMMASWLHSMAYADPERQKWWLPRFRAVSDILWFGPMILWFPFTIFHVFVVMCRKPRAKNDI
jgi:lysylphosphatidylglycerol synthetase-like protein (DUF2156 family)